MGSSWLSAKQVIAAVIGLVRSSLAVTLIRQATAPELPLLAAVAITAVVNVVALTWLAMPLSRAFSAAAHAIGYRSPTAGLSSSA